MTPKRTASIRGLLMILVALAFSLPSFALADQLTLLDSEVTFDGTNGGILYQNLPAGFPTDLTAPVDFAGGTIHLRATVSTTPGGTQTGLLFCLVQTDRMPANRACTPANDIQFGANGTFETSVAVGSLTQIANLDLATALAEFAIMVTDTAGEVIDTNNPSFVGAPDTTLYLPLTARVEAELVSNGDAFGGFPSDMTGMSADPTFNPGGGSFENMVSVQIESPAGGDIFYTTDGSDPTTASTAYTGAVDITNNTTIKAIAVEAGMDPSNIVEASYTITQGSNNGLRGRYFEGANFENLVTTRTDPTIEFSYPGGEPPAGVGSKPFSVLWTGTVEPLYSETYTFKTVNDDGVRLWIDGDLIIDDWEAHGALERTGTITLQAGQQYSVWLEYFDGGGAGEVSLSWVSDTQPEEIIPDSAMLPTDGPAGQPPVSLLAEADENEVNESAPEPFTFQIKRRGNLENALDVSLMVTGDATNGEDFSVPASVTIPAGQLSATVEVTVIDDEEVEGAESATITLTAGNGYELAEPLSTTISILDDDIDVFAIAGQVLYSGTESGKIVVEAFTEETLVFASRQQVLLNPGPFTIPGVEPGDYTVIAYIDSNGNELLDSGETWSIYQDDAGDDLKITIPNEDNVEVIIDLDRRPGEEANNGDDEGGCGCATTDPGAAGGSILLVLIGLFGLRRRRR